MKVLKDKIYEAFFTNIGNSKDVRGEFILQNLRKKLEGMTIDEFCRRKLGFKLGAVALDVFVMYLSLSAKEDGGLYSISDKIYVDIDYSDYSAITLKDILEKRNRFYSQLSEILEQMIIDLSKYNIEIYKKYKHSPAKRSMYMTEDVAKLFKYELENPNDLNIRDCFYIRCKAIRQKKVYKK